MTTPVSGATPGAAPAAQPEHERLRKIARDLEGVFVEQMFKAMRETVPEGGVVDGGSGEAMFAGMLDQQMATRAPDQWERGLSDALYRQLRGRVTDEVPPPAAASFSSPPGAPILSSASSPRPEPS